LTRELKVLKIIIAILRVLSCCNPRGIFQKYFNLALKCVTFIKKIAKIAENGRDATSRLPLKISGYALFHIDFLSLVYEDLKQILTSLPERKGWQSMILKGY